MKLVDQWDALERRLPRGMGERRARAGPRAGLRGAVGGSAARLDEPWARGGELALTVTRRGGSHRRQRRGASSGLLDDARVWCELARKATPSWRPSAPAASLRPARPQALSPPPGTQSWQRCRATGLIFSAVSRSTRATSFPAPPFFARPSTRPRSRAARLHLPVRPASGLRGVPGDGSPLLREARRGGLPARARCSGSSHRPTTSAPRALPGSSAARSLGAKRSATSEGLAAP